MLRSEDTPAQVRETGHSTHASDARGDRRYRPTGTLQAAIDPSNFLLVAGEDGDPTPIGRSPRTFAMCSVHSL